MNPGREGADAPGPGRFFITGLGIGQICSWGSLYYAFPLIAAAMSRDLGWSKTELYGAATLGLILAGLAAMPVGAAIDRGHGRAVMMLGSIAAGLAMVAWSQVTGLAAFYVLLAGLGALQAATLYDPAFAVVARRMGPTRARAGITALSLWGGFASTVFVPLVQFLLDRIGWRDTLLVLGAINLIVCAGLNAAVIDRHEAPSASPPGPTPAARSPSDSGLAVLLREPTFWALAIAFTAFAATFSAFTYHLYPLLLERGFASTDVVAAMMIIGPMQVGGRIAIWVLARAAPVSTIGSVVVLGFPLALVALAALPPSFAVVAFVAALYGAANGIMTIVRGLAVPEMLTRRAYGAINGALSAPATIARAVAPLGAALIWSATGSYDGVLVAAIGGSLVFAFGFWGAGWLSRPYRRRLSAP
ncbi:MFS transporter [Siculibacillus lacustris]|uniref:MFS transporter n=1 Tax=Siculibacillus lacustris TaxID=1549641 RepID=A0A4Q9VF00_9HYPH|nr:MFS transporter [Siculibacillus lacustris]TBW33412.1 MFS transporter [Siculibacillus lacustris]